jgi:aryl-alcohol dehydrogenase-like predicted oxidoreductase
MSIDKIILGTVQFGLNYGISNTTGKPSVESAFAILDTAKQSGIKMLDTAQAYGNSMEVIGKYHRSRTAAFEVISKFHLNSENLQEVVINELKTLSISGYEALLFHSFSDFWIAENKVFHALRALKQNGLLKKTGVSVYTNDEFKRAIEHDEIDVIQLPFNLLDNNSQRGALMEEAKTKGKELHIRSVFLQGLFFLEEDKIPDKLSPLKPYLSHIRTVALKFGLTINQLSLAYAMSNPNIDRLLIGVLTEEQLKENLHDLAYADIVSPEVISEVDRVIVDEINLLNPVNWK